MHTFSTNTYTMYKKVGVCMNYESLLNEIKNSKVVYLDSSSLIRNYPIHILSKHFTRTKYLSNPQKFTNILNLFINPIYDISILLYNILDEATKSANNINILTYDCIFPSKKNKCICALFGSFDFAENNVLMNTSIALFGDQISVETFFYASTLIRSANLIIVDDYFLYLPLGKELINRKKEDATIIMLSNLIGYHNYKSQDVINIFKLLPI